MCVGVCRLFGARVLASPIFKVSQKGINKVSRKGIPKKTENRACEPI